MRIEEAPVPPHSFISFRIYFILFSSYLHHLVFSSVAAASMGVAGATRSTSFFFFCFLPFGTWAHVDIRRRHDAWKLSIRHVGIVMIKTPAARTRPAKLSWHSASVGKKNSKQQNTQRDALIIVIRNFSSSSRDKQKKRKQYRKKERRNALTFWPSVRRL